MWSRWILSDFDQYSGSGDFWDIFIGLYYFFFFFPFCPFFLSSSIPSLLLLSYYSSDSTGPRPLQTP
ncbi:hypothetical protein BDV59DRAFT_167425 [Aspergillus ambiguus]|uniref:uncharacterized protein n=1 Tax=Aspergillus ambiguus TaxID=176160 RepID=UPI003CCDEAA2